MGFVATGTTGDTAWSPWDGVEHATRSSGRDTQLKGSRKLRGRVLMGSVHHCWVAVSGLKTCHRSLLSNFIRASLHMVVWLSRRIETPGQNWSSGWRSNFSSRSSEIRLFRLKATALNFMFLSFLRRNYCLRLSITLVSW